MKRRWELRIGSVICFICGVRDAFVHRVRDKSQLDRRHTVSVRSSLLNLLHKMSMQEARWACLMKILKTQLDRHFTHLYAEFVTYLYIEFVTHLYVEFVTKVSSMDILYIKFSSEPIFWELRIGSVIWFICGVRDAFVYKVRDKSQLDRRHTVNRIASRISRIENRHSTQIYIEFVTHLYVDFVTKVSSIDIFYSKLRSEPNFYTLLCRVRDASICTVRDKSQLDRHCIQYIA